MFQTNFEGDFIERYHMARDEGVVVIAVCSLFFVMYYSFSVLHFSLSSL